MLLGHARGLIVVNLAITQHFQIRLQILRIRSIGGRLLIIDHVVTALINGLWQCALLNLF